MALLFPLFLAAPSHAEKVDQLKARGYVNDFAGVLNAPTQAQVTALCEEVDEKTQAQIAVVTIKTLEGLEAADFANQLFKKWGVGHRGDNRGVLTLLATNDHKYWTEVGYGLEPILPDGKVGEFGREMVPFLRSGDYNGGVLRLTSQIAVVIAADREVKLNNLAATNPTPVQQPATEDDTNPFVAGILALAAIIGIALLGWGAYTAPTRRRGGGGFWRVARFIAVILGSLEGGGSFGGGRGFGRGGGFGGFGGGSSGGGGAGGSW